MLKAVDILLISIVLSLAPIFARFTTMCWCLRVYWTVLHNLFVRFFDNVGNFFYNGLTCCFCRSGGECFSCQKYKQTTLHASDISIAITAPDGGSITTNAEGSSANNHDYVIVDEIDADYLEIQKHKIETEPYYRTVDRATAEEILTCREDGSCLVRPYKETDIAIKYIVSIYAQQQFFHLFIRQIYDKELYGIGQEKAHEKLFTTPSDIIEFYRYNPLLCTNKLLSLSLILQPIVA